MTETQVLEISILRALSGDESEAEQLGLKPALPYWIQISHAVVELASIKTHEPHLLKKSKHLL